MFFPEDQDQKEFLIDSHCHLDFSIFQDSLTSIIDEAHQVGIKYMQTISTKISTFSQILEIANKFKNVFCSVGLHPCNVLEEEIPTAQQIIEMCNTNIKVIGIGETGLDYYHNSEKKLQDAQKRSFIEHIQAAQITGLPVIIHSRSAEQDTIAIIKEQLLIAPFKALIHCFTGSSLFAEQCLDLGLYISASGIITFKNAIDIREIFSSIVPLNRILLETDAPYLAPIPYRGRTNKPSYLPQIAMEIAKLKSDISIKEVAAITSDNFFQIFDFDKKIIK